MINRRLLVLLLVGLLLAGGGLAYLAFKQAIAWPESVPLPDAVADLPRYKTLTGQDAAADIAHLHRQGFPLSGAAVGAYRAGPHSATLWVSESPLALLAARMEAQMEQKIAAGESPFTPQEGRRMDGQAIHVLTGMGQQHFYFRSGKRVIWLAVDAALAGVGLEEVQAFYR